MKTEKELEERRKEPKYQFEKSFNRDGTAAPDLIDVVLQNCINGQLLFRATMSRESLGLTLETRRIVLYSRSRKCLWWKGKRSGDELLVKEVYENCEMNCLLIKVKLLGNGVCHQKDKKGRTRKSCFTEKIFVNKIDF